MAARSKILDLLLSEDPESAQKLRAVVEEAASHPAMKLSGGSERVAVPSKVIRPPPGKWTAPPGGLTGNGPGPGSSVSAAAKLPAASSVSASAPASASSATPITAHQTPRPASPAPKPTPAPALKPAPPALGPCALVPSGRAGSEAGSFCVCGGLDDNPDETFVKCAVGTGGCNGWVHLRCSELSEDAIDDIVLSKKQPSKFVCSLCKALPAAVRRKAAPTGPGALASPDGAGEVDDIGGSSSGGGGGGGGDAPPPKRQRPVAMERSGSTGSTGSGHGAGRSELLKHLKLPARGRR